MGRRGAGTEWIIGRCDVTAKRLRTRRGRRGGKGTVHTRRVDRRALQNVRMRSPAAPPRASAAWPSLSGPFQPPPPLEAAFPRPARVCQKSDHNQGHP